MNVVYIVSIDYGYDGQKPIVVYEDKKQAEDFVRLASKNCSSYLIEEVEFLGKGGSDDRT